MLVLGILAAIVLPKFVGASTRNREIELSGDLKMLRNAVHAYHSDTGLYPTRLSDLAAKVSPGSGFNADGVPKPLKTSNWRGPYLDSIPSDPISGEPFLYSATRPTVGRISSSSASRSIDGIPYKNW